MIAEIGLWLLVAAVPLPSNLAGDLAQEVRGVANSQYQCETAQRLWTKVDVVAVRCMPTTCTELSMPTSLAGLNAQGCALIEAIKQ